MEEIYQGYKITAAPVKNRTGRWSVAVIISLAAVSASPSKKFIADDGISYILEEEAAKECINLGRNIIKNGRVGLPGESNGQI